MGKQLRFSVLVTVVPVIVDDQMNMEELDPLTPPFTLEYCVTDDDMAHALATTLPRQHMGWVMDTYLDAQGMVHRVEKGLPVYPEVG